MSRAEPFPVCATQGEKIAYRKGYAAGLRGKGECFNQQGKALKRAAELLEEDAAAVKRSHTTTDGEWDLSDPCDVHAKDDHDERMALAVKLRLIAPTAGDV